ncbi:MAG: GNAT family N-acetyltransferase [Candidatus Buchananbacteria bacterium]|nr:GNAT family N-acetyltransferase [Candidatus Buchananbacteria bacterium]
MQIKQATAADEARIKEFSAAEWPAADLEHFGTAEVDFKRREFTFVAEIDGQLVGYIVLKTDMGVCKIDSLITSQAHRGQGIGKLLMSQAESQAQAEDCHKLRLETGADWAARKFYESLGYTVAATLTNHYAHKDFVIMEKFL